jgi:hypothetical protein
MNIKFAFLLRLRNKSNRFQKDGAAVISTCIGGASTGANCRLMLGGNHSRWTTTPMDPGGLQHPSEVTHKLI